MEAWNKASLAQLPQVRALGRHTGRDPLTLFWTASGIELDFTGSALWVDFFADYTAVEPWVSVELNGAWIARFAVNPGHSRVCLFRGMTPGKPKHIRLLKDVQAMHEDPAHLLQITGLEYADGVFLPLPEPRYRLEFVGDSITSGEGAIGAKSEEDWAGAFFSAENHYARMTADALGAEYRCLSQSGWGITASWENDPTHILPPYYTQVCGVAQGERNAALGAQQPNDFAAWQPDAVILNLGTNDNGAFDEPAWIGGCPADRRCGAGLSDRGPGKESAGAAGMVHRNAGHTHCAGAAAGRGAVQGGSGGRPGRSAEAAGDHTRNRGCPPAPRRGESPPGGGSADGVFERTSVNKKCAACFQRTDCTLFCVCAETLHVARPILLGEGTWCRDQVDSRRTKPPGTMTVGAMAGLCAILRRS